jgi:hypothetical protein
VGNNNIQATLSLLPGDYSVTQLKNGNLRVTKENAGITHNLLHGLGKDLPKRLLTNTGASYELQNHPGSNFRINIAGDSSSESKVKVKGIDENTNIVFGGNPNAQDKLQIDVWQSKGAISFDPEGDNKHGDQVKIKFH